jgi:hypothetical protein
MKEGKSKSKGIKLKKVAISSIIILIVGLGSYMLFSYNRDIPLIEVTPKAYNFGVVSQGWGVVTTLLTLENKGSGDLVINGMWTSCGCTQASLIINGEEGPRFGMHNNPQDWSATLKPGEVAQLKVYYDPNVHPVRGHVTRIIEIYSNDPKNPTYRVQIDLMQTG